MIKSIKINLFEKNRKEVFNEINIEIPSKEIFIYDSNKYLNGNIINEYIKLLTKPLQLKEGPELTKSSTNNAMLISDENIDIYQKNIEIIKEIDKQITTTLFNKLLGFEDEDEDGIEKYLSLNKDTFKKFAMSNKLTIDFYNLIKKINTKLSEINYQIKINSNYTDLDKKFYNAAITAKQLILDKSNPFSEKDIKIEKQSDIFIKKEIVEDLFKKLDNKLLYDKSREDIYDRERDSILKQYWKYCFPNKKFDLSTFITEQQKRTVITFYNIYFILKNYYLIDTTKIIYHSKKKPEYLIKNFDLLDLNNKDLINSNIDLTKIINIKKEEIEVTFQCVLNRLFNIPNLKINFNFHDIENGEPDEPLIFNNELLPKMIDPSFNNYDEFYIDLLNNINYKTSQENYQKILNKINKEQKRKTNLLNKNDFFFNKTLTNSFIEANSFIEENKKIVKGDKVKKDKDNKKRFENIYYLLINHFNLLNKKIFINNDYYLIEEIFLLEDNKNKNKNKNKDEGIFINVFNNKRESFSISPLLNFSNDISYINIDNTDEKEVAIHSIYLLFYVYKLKDKNETISLKRRVITEGCLGNASKLDSYFKDSLYRALQLNDNHLSNRLKQRGGIRVITKKYRNKRKRTTKKKNKSKKYKKYKKSKK